MNNCAVREPEIGAIGVSTECDPARSNLGQRFSGVDDCDILLGLVFENAQLGRAVLSDRMITIEMVGSKVEPQTDRWAKPADCFQLKRAHFDRQHVEPLVFPHDFAKRFADVTASDCSLAAEIQHLRQQLGRRGLSVRACNGDDRHFAEAPSKLQFADRFNFPRAKIAS